MTIVIRPLEDADINEVQSLILSIQREEFEIDISLDDQQDLLDINGFYRKGFGNFWVAVSDHEIVGSVALIDIGSRQVALRKMFVKKDFRGKEFGVAQRLLDHVLYYTRLNGLTQILLGTTDQFVAAHRFYEKNKFEIIELEALPEAFPRMSVDTRFYAKNIC